jgi:phage-related minor tail protein
MITRFSGMTDYEKLLTQSNIIDSAISNATGNRFARGGNMQSGRIGLVGEQGPELFLPRSSGMVLSNSISSRLMGMLGGGGMAMAGANNVTINVNNPVIRSDNDIRKLANEISKAQASQFRVNGGRLS